MAADNQSSDRNLDIKGDANKSNTIVGDGNSIQVTNVFNSIEVGPSGIRPSQTLSKQEYRWRQVLVDNIKHYWIEGVLERSLHNQALIELGLEERIGAVASPLSGVEEFPVDDGQVLPEGTQVTDVFDGLGAKRTLLILGEPGAGKTTTLLKLVQSLLARMGDDFSQPIPVILNLSSWAKKRKHIAEWLVQDLYETFQVSKALGTTWIKEEQLTLCLDGLDEVEAQHRDACVQALNEFMQAHGLTEIDICSRIKDYEALSNQLKLKNAIYVQPLTSEQIDQYLAQAREQLSALSTVFSRNPAIREFAVSPLILSVMSLAYQGSSLEEFPEVGSAQSFQQRLFDTYIERMFQRRGNTNHYAKGQAKHWLIWTARQMTQTSQTVFFIENLQPNCLLTWTQRLCYRLRNSLIFSLIVWLILEFRDGLTNGLSNGLSNGLIGGLIGVLITINLGEITPVETVDWSGKYEKKSLSSGLFLGIFGGLGVGLLFSDLLYGLFQGVLSGLVCGLLSGLKGPAMGNKTKPNQGIGQSARNAMVVAWTVGLFCSLGFELINESIVGLNDGLLIGLISMPHDGLSDGLIVGLIGGLVCGGSACLRHFSLRLMLYRLGYIRWNYARFLDYATERLFLQKVGGGYIFIHRMLLEHFAQMELKETK